MDIKDIANQHAEDAVGIATYGYNWQQVRSLIARAFVAGAMHQLQTDKQAISDKILEVREAGIQLERDAIRT